MQGLRVDEDAVASRKRAVAHGLAFAPGDERAAVESARVCEEDRQCEGRSCIAVQRGCEYLSLGCQLLPWCEATDLKDPISKPRHLLSKLHTHREAVVAVRVSSPELTHE